MKVETNSRKESWKSHKYLETKQHPLEPPVGQRRNHKGGEQLGNTDTAGAGGSTAEPQGSALAVLSGKRVAVQACIVKEGRLQNQ